MCAVALLSGCSMIPKYERPAAPIASDWPALNAAIGGASSTAGTAAGTSQSAADIEWQSFFSEPKLRQLIEASLRNNRDLRIAVLNIEQARAQYQIRRADQLPSLNAAFTGARQ